MGIFFGKLCMWIGASLLTIPLWAQEGTLLLKGDTLVVQNEMSSSDPFGLNVPSGLNNDPFGLGDDPLTYLTTKVKPKPFVSKQPTPNLLRLG
ncbi:MAG TPA: hypothetical protein VIU12_02865 [Chryseolinea sp.]